MRFKKGALHAFNTEYHKTGTHKLDRETVLLNQAQRGTLPKATAMNMVTGAAGVSSASLSRKLATRAKKAGK